MTPCIVAVAIGAENWSSFGKVVAVFRMPSAADGSPGAVTRAGLSGMAGGTCFE